MIVLWLLTLIAIPLAIVARILHYFYSLINAVKGLQGPKVYPIIGDIDMIKHRYDIINHLDMCCTRYPKIYRTWLGPQLALVLSDHELIKKVLSSQQLLKKPKIFYKVLAIPYGLIESEYDIWRGHRKIINPTFNPKILQSFVSIFIEKSENLIESLLKRGKGEEFDLFDETMICSMTTVFETTMGSEGLELAETENTIKGIHKALDFAANRVFNPLLLIQWSYLFTQQYKEEKTLRAELYTTVNGLINSRKVHFQNTPKETVLQTDEQYFKPQIFIDQLISLSMSEKSGVHLLNAEIQDECYTMVAAGSETTALTVANVILLLAMHSSVQDKVIQEIDEFLEMNETITVDNLRQLTYVDLVLKETLRLLPSVPLFARESMSDFDIGPCVIKPGMTVLINVFSLHRNKEVWGPDANEFRPERFEPEQFKNIHSHAYIPFSAGVRNCVGQRYGILSAKVMLIYLLKNFKFSTRLTLKELKFAYMISMRVCNRHLVTIERRV